MREAKQMGDGISQAEKQVETTTSQTEASTAVQTPEEPTAQPSFASKILRGALSYLRDVKHEDVGQALNNAESSSFRVLEKHKITPTVPRPAEGESSSNPEDENTQKG